MESRESPPEELETVELSDYLRVIRARKWVIIVATVVVAAVALGASIIMTPIYQAEARILHIQTNLDSALFGARLFEVRNQERDLQTGAELVRLENVARRVKEELGSPRSTGELLDMVRSQPDGQTDVINITAESPDPEEAAAVANTFAGEFLEYREESFQEKVAEARQMVKQELDSMSVSERSSDYGLMLRDKYEQLRILEAMQTGGFEMAQEANVPRDPVSPQPLRNGVLGLAVGLVLGLGSAFVLEYVDRRIKDEETLEREFGLPVLASVPETGKWEPRGQEEGKGRSDRPVGFAEENAPLLEAFRTLRTNLQYFEVDTPLRTLLVTSALPREGKTVATTNLALSLALSGRRVIVLECDLRRPMVGQYLGLGSEIGVSSVLAGRHTFAEALQLVHVDDFAPEDARRTHRSGGDASLLQKNLYVMTSGPLPPNPGELMGSERMSELVAEASEAADYVLVDSPPILVVADAITLSSMVDGVIVTARLYGTTTDEAQQVRGVLDRVGAHTIGVVAGGVKRSQKYYQQYGYGYYT